MWSAAAKTTERVMFGLFAAAVARRLHPVYLRFQSVRRDRRFGLGSRGMGGLPRRRRRPSAIILGNGRDVAQLRLHLFTLPFRLL